MAEDRNLSLGTIFTGDATTFLNEVKKVRAAIEDLNGVYKSQSKAFSDFSKASAGTTRAMGKSKSVLDDMVKANNSWGRSIQQTAERLGGGERAIQASERMHEKLARTVRNVSDQMNLSGKNGVKWEETLNAQAMKANVASGKIGILQGKFKSLGEEVKKSSTFIQKHSEAFESAFKRIGSSAKVIASYGAASAVIYGVISAFRTGVSEIINFDQALKNLQAITRASDAELQGMRDEMIKVANETKFSATEVGDAMVLLGQSGLSAAESIDAIGNVAELATGTLASMATVTDLMTTTMRSFGLQSFETSRIADVMANAVNKSKLTIDKLRIAFNYVGPAAYATGTSLEETAAAMMSLANSGLRASTIGTGLRQIFARLVAPNRKLKEAFQEAGISIDQLDIKAHGFQGVLKNLVRIFQDSKSGVTDASKAFKLFGLRGANAILALVKAYSTGDYQKFLDSVYEIGTAGEMAEKQMEGLAVQFKNLADRAKNLFIAVGEGGFTGVLRALLTTARAVVGTLEGLSKTFGGQLLIAFTTAAAGIYAITAALTGLSVAIKLVHAHLGKLFMSMLTNPIGQLILVIAGVVTAIQAWNKWQEKHLRDMERTALTAEKNIRSLESYRGALKSMHEDVEKGKKTQKEYQALIERLKKDFPELADKIDEARGSLKKLTGVLDEALGKNAQVLLETNVKLIEEYQKNVERSAFWAGVTEGAWKKSLEATNKELVEAEQNWNKIVNWVREFVGLAPKTAGPEGGGFEVPETTFIEKFVGYYKELGMTTKEVTSLMGEQKTSIDKVATAYANMIMQGKIGLPDLKNELLKIDSSLSGFNIAKVISATMAKLDQLKKKTKDVGKDLKNTVEGMEEPWKTFWQYASPENKDEILSIYKKMEKEIESLGKTAKKYGLTSVTDTRVIEQQKFSIRLQAYLKARTLMEKETEDAKVAEQQQIDFLKEAEKKIIGNKLDALDRGYEQEKARAGDNAEKLIAIEEEYASKREAFLVGMAQSTADKLRIIWAQEAKHREKMLVEGFKQAHKEMTDAAVTATDDREHKISMAVGASIDKQEKMALELAQFEKQTWEDIVAADEQAYLRLLELYGSKDEETRKALERLKESKKTLLGKDEALRQEEYNQALEKFNKELNYMEGNWKAGRVTAEQYYQYLKVANDQGIISTRELEEAHTRMFGTMGDNAALGFARAQESAKKWADVMQDIGNTVVEQLADGLYTVFETVIDGSESAGEAFKKFAIGMLKWMAQILMKQALMDMMFKSFGGRQSATGGFDFLGGLTSMVGLGGGSPFSGMAGYGGGIGLVEHGGGVAGKEGKRRYISGKTILENLPLPRFHKGLGADEVLSVLRKDETVFTPQQMKQLGAVAGGGTTVNIPISITGAGSITEQGIGKLKSGIEDTVRRILSQEMR